MNFLNLIMKNREQYHHQVYLDTFNLKRKHHKCTQTQY